MSASAKSTLGIIAGGGRLPLKIIEACRQAGRPCFVLALEDAADLTALSDAPRACVRLGAVGEAMARLRSAGVRELVLAGSIRRPSMTSLKPDAAGARLIARLGLKLFSGDDALLKALVGFLEEEGFVVLGAEDVLGGSRAPGGVLTASAPDARAHAAIALGLKVVKTLGELDVGQAVVVENGYVLGVEAAEGTDALIARCAPLMREGAAVLVKARKPGQEERTDLPAVGPRTIEKLYAAGMRGVAVEAGGVLLLEQEEMVALADRYGLFIVGVAGD